MYNTYNALVASSGEICGSDLGIACSTGLGCRPQEFSSFKTCQPLSSGSSVYLPSSTSGAGVLSARAPQTRLNQMCDMCANVQLGGGERLTYDSVCLDGTQDGLGCLSIEEGSRFNGCRYFKYQTFSCALIFLDLRTIVL